ncbi:hypothetical protein DOTSEDRAFT_70712 [Dothistroma septosporum NZE10]|uniref:Uncharacterized protein n=1 Tax=Dothistroma septosporum (strain NZE10 / CBS 128990) TaxID=675120 RepID=N1PWQ0_DOTSN|nr:hypothetical protein DOTSEDRAFT_70712 [Dothistroma septosporum NZE10]
MSWERGPTYHMNDAILFKEVIAVRTDSAEGQAYRHNQRLLEVADKIARDKMAVEWYRDPNANMGKSRRSSNASSAAPCM